MSQSYDIPALSEGASHEAALTIRRSRFVTRIAHADTPEGARAFVESVRDANRDATHNCWAFNAGAPGSTAQIGASDDGEPHGTAGRPMLSVLLHSDVGEICCVVSRWFGGIKLGTGGLVRAYQDCVSSCLETLPRVRRASLARLRVEAAWADVDRVRRLLPAHGARVTAEEYGEGAVLDIEMPEQAVRTFADDLLRLTNGRARLVPAGEGDGRAV